MIIVAGLAFIGLCAGSFVNALVYRLRWQETHRKKNARYSILRGRSICPKCKHTLSYMDMIPVLSWISLRGKCRYCNKPISPQYPLVEAATAILFVLSYVFWPYGLTGASIIEFILWLAILTGLVALVVYDMKWMILPNKIIFPLYALALSSVLIRYISSADYNFLVAAAAGTVVGGGIFYVLFQVSGGKWIGGGDVKLGFLLGALAGGPLAAFLMIFIASLLGSVFSIPMIIKNQLGGKAKIAFGPFLIFAALITVLTGERIIDIYSNMLML